MEITFHQRNKQRSAGALANQHAIPCRSERRFFDCLSEERASLRKISERSANGTCVCRAPAAAGCYFLEHWPKSKRIISQPFQHLHHIRFFPGRNGNERAIVQYQMTTFGFDVFADAFGIDQVRLVHAVEALIGE